MTNQIVSMLKEKLQDWFIGLSDEEKEKYNGMDLNFLVDQLMGIGNNEANIKDDKSGTKKDKNDSKPQKDSSKHRN